MTPQEAEALDALCRLSLDAYTQRVFRILEPGIPYQWNWHIGCVADHLEAVYSGDIKRLIINIPPRTLKSIIVGRAFPSWVLGKQPQTKFICASYSYEVAEANAVGARRIMADPWYQHCFPQAVIDSNMDRKTHFTTTMAGQYYAATALSSITGLGADYLLLDDPLKPMDAYSETIRNSTNQNIRTTLFSRFNDQTNGKMILIMQRLHEDDPTGNLLMEGGYTHLKLPAEAKRYISISLKDKKWEMKEGDLLFPARLGHEELARLQRDMTEYNYVGQYLQEPAPIGGGEFKEEWAQYYDKVSPKNMNVYILVDASDGRNRSSDYTAMAVVGLGQDKNYYLLDMIRDRLNPTERVDRLFSLHRKWSAAVGKPIKVGYEKYGMMTDTHYIREKQNFTSYRFPVIELGGSMMKENRIRRMIPDMQQMRWYFPYFLNYTDKEGRTSDLIKDLVKGEMLTFPNSKYDDMIDALSRVYDDDMGAVFPQLKKSSPVSSEPQDWMSF